MRREVRWNARLRQLQYYDPDGWHPITLAVSGGGGGGGGVTDHAALTSLVWTSSGHTGTANRIAAFGGGGATAYLQVGADVQAWGANLDAYSGLAGTGLVVHTGPGTAAARSLAIDAGSTSYASWADADAVSGNPTLSILVHAILDLLVDDRFGDGSDGAVVLTGNITLTRDMQYASLDLAGFTIDASQCRVRVQGTLSDSGGSGRIHSNGSNAPGASNSGGSGGVSSVPLGRGSNGGSGGSTGGAAGSAGQSLAEVWAASPQLGLPGTPGRGGAGGSSGVLGGGNAGTVTAPSTAAGAGGSYFWDTLFFPSGPSSGLRVNGGSGGGGGGSQAGTGSRGGGGGAGGDVVYVAAREVDCPNTTKLQALGGDGAAAVLGTSAGCGGGGGGAGGVVVLVYARATSLPTLEAFGGSGGSGAGAGSAGSAGSDGYTVARAVRL